MRYFSALLLVLFLTVQAQAQLKRTFHQTFEIDSVQAIALNLAGDYTVNKWPGNQIMTVTKVALYDANAGVLGFFADSLGRYEILLNTESSPATLTSKDKERRSIRYKGIDCYEEVKVEVLVPEDFTTDNPALLARKPE